MRLQGKLPLLLSLTMIIVLSTLAYFRIIGLDGLAYFMTLTIVVLYGLWIVVEGEIAAKEVAKENTRADKGTMELYAASRGFTVVAALALEPLFYSPILMTVGLALFLFSVSFRLLAIYTLGRHYSHRVRILEDHSIIQSGPYRLVRHPAYTGMFLAHLGFVLFFFNWLSLGVLVFLLLPSIIVRILHEEKALMNVRGYREYSSQVKRLIPVIW